MSLTNVTGQLVQIAVPGTNATIPAAEIDGKPMVALRPMCDAIGIDADSQARKLKARSWATTVMSTVVAADGKPRTMLLIDRRTMTMWLATLDENRVSETAKPTVVAFQAEAADALDAYFHTGQATNPRGTALSTFDILRAQIDQLEAAQRTANEAKAIAAKTEARLDAIEGRHDWFAAVGYAKTHDIPNTSTQFLAKVGRQAASIARANGIEPVPVQHALYGRVNTLPAWVWEIAFEGRQA
ncbi:phage antirepressor [Rhodococcus sp. p52]|uniref:phage antirepressor N-terminal domain-containing protein n=1 Tax=Rhodococcus sp. p52 TaxID=935199 RepID=UPI0008267665|nr:phage antirepressor N-terminal domain-containing protein [Rhodococcus sp. p52]AOD23827.1 phage antirepressor [Rhodococcus sp. p52]